jgi:hypothetical protein
LTILETVPGKHTDACVSELRPVMTCRQLSPGDYDYEDDEPVEAPSPVIRVGPPSLSP